jgi:acyl-CoA thioesterase FadM
MFNEELVVETWVREIRGARIFFGNRVVRPEGGGETVVAEAAICGALLGADGRPHRFSEDAAAWACHPARHAKHVRPHTAAMIIVAVCGDG